MKALVFLAGLMLCASSASAATLYQQNPNNVFDNGGNASVSGISNRNGTFRAGGFRLKDESNNQFVAWCLDVLHNLSLPSSYTVTNTPFENSNPNANTVHLSNSQKLNIASLFTLNYNDDLLADGAKSAGFQLALWELVYETLSGDVGFSVSNGSWTATNSSGVGFANTFLEGLKHLPAKQTFNLTFYQSHLNPNGVPYSQSLVSATPVPIPPALALLATAIGGLGFFRWKGRKDPSA